MLDQKRPGTRDRLGLYNDDVYRITASEGGTRISTDRAFLLFACEVGKHFEQLVLFGRAIAGETPADYVLPEEVRLVSLPYYENVARVLQLSRAAIGTAVSMWRGLADVDRVWIFGPHPFALLLVLLAMVRRRTVVLGVRQDTTEYFRARLPSRRWKPVLAGVWMLDLAYRALGRRLGVTVVGRRIAHHYGAETPQVLDMVVTLVRAADVAPRPPERDWSETIGLLTIGRLEPEKNPFLLLEVLARLEAEHASRFHLTWVGRGVLAEAVDERARALGLGDRLTRVGYVPFGSELLDLYGAAHIFVHVSLTEGVPQVLVEALARGTPVVATDVGGVRDVLDGGRAGLLVPPREGDALSEAIVRIADDEALRSSLVRAGLEIARARTLEREARRVARFVAGGLRQTPAHAEAS
jgi:glycosyltransferase involved in cell wall biosynthesis